jgi:uncharacterized protein (DUF433 family)
MSTVLSLRLRADQVDRLQRAARQVGRRPSEMAALLLEEALRQQEFALIEFRDSPAGRQAYVKGTRLQAWWLAHLAWDDHLDADQIAVLLDIPLPAVKSALAYAAAYPEEMREAIRENQRPIENLKRSIPNVEIVTVDTAGP